MPDCIYRLSHHGKSLCVIKPAHVTPCLGRNCCSGFSEASSPAFRPAMKGRLKFWISTKDPTVLQDPRAETLRSYPHLGLVEVCASEQDLAKLAVEKGIKTEHISKGTAYHAVIWHDAWNLQTSRRH